MTGMNTSIAILAALYHRKVNGGEGQHLDVCLLDTVIASLSHYAQIYLVSGKMPPRRGTWGNGGMTAGVFRCADGELMLVVGNDGQFARTCQVLGSPELATNPKFLENHDRVARGMEIKVDHPFEHALSLIRNPITFSATPVKDYRAPPLLGENTREVLAAIGYDDAKMEGLKKQGII